MKAFLTSLWKGIKSIWSGVTWFFREILNLYSNQESFFSKKRVESGIAFIIGQWGMMYWLSTKISQMSTSDFAIWAGMEFAISGYMLTQIQKEKFKFRNIDASEIEDESSYDSNSGTVLKPQV